jgi:hypothetical protein
MENNMTGDNEKVGLCMIHYETPMLLEKFRTCVLGDVEDDVFFRTPVHQNRYPQVVSSLHQIEADIIFFDLRGRAIHLANQCGMELEEFARMTCFKIHLQKEQMSISVCEHEFRML